MMYKATIANQVICIYITTVIKGTKTKLDNF